MQIFNYLTKDKQQMSFLSEELINVAFKNLAGNILGSGNRNTTPDNLAYYEEEFSPDKIIKPQNIWTQFSSIPSAGNLATAQSNAVANPTIIQDYTSAPIHCTPSDNGKLFLATSTYNDLTTRLKNWIQPQMIPNAGRASIGYFIRVYNGNPLTGGTEIPFTQDKSGAITGFVIDYASGAILFSSSFSFIIDPTNIWITGFRYIGLTGATSGGGGGNSYFPSGW